MTSEEIKLTAHSANPDVRDEDMSFWLKEIAYQLAVMNERAEAKPIDETFAKLALLLGQMKSSNDAYLGAGWENRP